MAKMNFFILFLFAATSIVASALEEVEIAPSAGDEFAIPPGSVYDEDEHYDDALPPNSSPEELRSLKECMRKMKPECAKEVFQYMFKEVTVKEECCKVLVAMGEPCHITLVKTVFSIPEFKANAELGIGRSKNLWNKCASVVAPDASSPIPSVYY